MHLHPNPPDPRHVFLPFFAHNLRLSYMHLTNPFPTVKPSLSFLSFLIVGESVATPMTEAFCAMGLSVAF
jgi:hypothetical protein